MISHLRDSDLRVSWQSLLHEAVTQPGTLHEGYTRFWNYSIGNQILAMIQCRARGLQPGPLATFEKWKQLGRYVKKGEQALTLCMPITLKAKEWDEKRGESGSSAIHGENGSGPRTVFVYKKRWFVLAQTEGRAYEPEPIPEWDRDAALMALGIQEEPFQMMDGNCQGYATKDRKIAVSPVAVLPHKTFFHELAHIVLGHIGDDPMTDGEKLTRSLQEVEAEAVALICCETLGLPGAEEARGYIQHWLERKEDVSEKMAQRILSSAAKVLQAGIASKKNSKSEEGAWMKRGSVTASLEGMRVVVEDGICRLEEYDFVKNLYSEKDSQPWPLSEIVASEWLAGWNDFDRRLATSLLFGDATEEGL